ncbi:hypothetical protein [Neptunomonas sp.]|uniref:hypothetical protein n=1 Tax=Neptunomonas sp. TaxID=1971898 RepID=UPI003569A8F9
MQAKEIRIEPVFRYANPFPRTIALPGAGKSDIEPLLSAAHPFEQGIGAFVRAARADPTI